MTKMNMVTTRFKNRTTESRYRDRQERFAGPSLGSLALILLLSVTSKLAVLPRLSFSSSENYPNTDFYNNCVYKKTDFSTILWTP